jgi:hypothetical protein
MMLISSCNVSSTSIFILQFYYFIFDLHYHCFVGKHFCMAQIEELCANPGSLSCHEHVDSFMQLLSLVQVKDTPPFVLTPLLPDEMHEANILRW